MTDFILQVPIDIDGDSEADFFDTIVAMNEGQAIQELAGGKASNFAKITTEQKKNFALNQIGRTFSQVYQNAKDEARLNELRQTIQTEREAKRAAKG